MNAKLRILRPLTMSIIGAMCAVSGCRSYDPVYNGRSSTSRENNTQDRCFDVTQRAFPANIDEEQFCMFGTNGWMKVELYPDGMPCRITRGGTAIGGERGLITTEMEFDFDGNIISKFPVWANVKIPGYSSAPPVKESPYWMQGLRVRKVVSRLTLDYYFGVYYYQASDTNLEVCAWGIDRKRKQMDKLVFSLGLKDGHPVFEPDIKFHDGSLTELSEVRELDADCIGLNFKLHIEGQCVPINGSIFPVDGLTFGYYEKHGAKKPKEDNSK